MNCDVELIDVCKRFGEVEVLTKISVGFSSGKIHGLIGRNGSGKTVLLKCICGLIRSYTGTIKIRDNDRNRDICEIGMIIETPGFVNGYSGYDNLKFLADIRRKIGKAEITDAMRLVGLDVGSRKRVEKYSLGMRQRLGIAQAIMENPDLLILDEPMNGLDNAGVRDMRSLFKELRARGKTLIIASHNPLDVKELCDTVCEMDGGRLQVVRQ